MPLFKCCLVDIIVVFVSVFFDVHIGYAQLDWTSVLVCLCARFTFELDVNHKVEMLPTLTLKAKHGMKLKFTARN